MSLIIDKNIITKNLMQVVVQILKDTGTKTVASEEWARACYKYTDRFLLRHGNIKVLGMPKPISLAKIYTSVRMLNPLQIKSFSSIQALENSFKNSTERSLYVY